jgi:hypothetical protein
MGERTKLVGGLEKTTYWVWMEEPRIPFPIDRESHA